MLGQSRSLSSAPQMVDVACGMLALHFGMARRGGRVHLGTYASFQSYASLESEFAFKFGEGLLQRPFLLRFFTGSQQPRTGWRRLRGAGAVRCACRSADTAG